MPVTEYNLITEKSTSQCPEKINGIADNNSSAQDAIGKVSTREICVMSRQFATLLNAGMPVVHALNALIDQLCDSEKTKTEKPLAVILSQVVDDVNAGTSLADALSKYPHVFSKLYISMISAGQASGTLEHVLSRLAEMLEKRMQIANKVKAALAYPAMMTVVAFGVVVFLLSVVVPSLTEIFMEMNRELPLPTLFLISISDFIRNYAFIIALFLCGSAAAVSIWLRKDQGRQTADEFMLRTPLLGSLIMKLETARMARTIAILLSSGIPLLTALDIIKTVAQNTQVASAINSIGKMVQKGYTLADSIKKTKMFPPIVFHMVSTGQMSGDIESSFNSIAQMYEDDIETTSKTLTSLLEPAILLIMGLVIGFIVLAVLLPIFEINQAI